MYRIVIKRCEKDNPLTGMAAYRVVSCYEANPWQRKVRRLHSIGAWGIMLSKPRQINSFINPSKAMFPPNMKGVKA